MSAISNFLARLDNTTKPDIDATVRFVEPRCETCRFGTGSGKRMSCCRYPESIVVADVHWCGEWRAQT